MKFCLQVTLMNMWYNFDNFKPPPTSSKKKKTHKLLKLILIKPVNFFFKPPLTTNIQTQTQARTQQKHINTI